jgi:phytoene/squalene synthetase
LIDAFSECEQAVRAHDPDRFFAVLFAPDDKRPHLYALAALYYEIAHAASAPREPMLKEIRLTWWRETIERARDGKPRDHAVARALTETLQAYDLPDALFEAMIDARGAGFAGAAAAEAHADATVGSLMRLMARVLGGEADVRDAAIAYGLAGRHDGAFADIDTDTLAKQHFAQARRTRIPRALLPTVLPAALVPLYLKRSDPPLWHKQIAYLGAVLRGRI